MGIIGELIDPKVTLGYPHIAQTNVNCSYNRMNGIKLNEFPKELGEFACKKFVFPRTNKNVYVKRSYLQCFPPNWPWIVQIEAGVYPLLKNSFRGVLLGSLFENYNFKAST